MMSNDDSGARDSTFYLRFYDLETYLFEVVNENFRRDGHLNAFDLFSIVIWKSNRSKSYFARRLLAVADSLGLEHDLDALAHRLTKGLKEADTDEERFTVLFGDWGITLPVASAILTVLFPEDFTVYDRRVCDQLNGFHNLVNKVSVKNLWIEFSKFIEKVKGAVPSQPRLRDKDCYLFGKSVAKQLETDISNLFVKEE